MKLITIVSLLTANLLLSLITFAKVSKKNFYPQNKQVELINNKAAYNSPDSSQLSELHEEYLSWEFGMFIHFNMATFNEREWANGYEDPASFSPEKLDCNQWAEVAKNAGMEYAVLTVKHTGGWCLWDSKFTSSHDITAFKNYKNGGGDIVREFVDAFRKNGIKVGLYYCFPGDYCGRHGNVLPDGKPDLHGLPPEAKGDYVGFIKNQLTELMTNYGKIDLIWIDQFTNKYTYPAWPEIRKHIKSHQPKCLVIGNNADNFEESDILGYEYPYWKDRNPNKAIPPAKNTKPSEVCDKIGPGWFWSTEENSTNLKSAEEIAKMLNLSNNRSANYLLNIAPDSSGLIPEHTVQRLKEFRFLMNEKYGCNEPSKNSFFNTGDRACFIGNSITNNGLFHHNLFLYHSTRFPNRPVTFFNCGVSGDKTDRVLNRLNDYILINQPTVAVIMLGMNDVNRSLYGPSPTNNSDTLRLRSLAIDTYKDNMENIIKLFS